MFMFEVRLKISGSCSTCSKFGMSMFEVFGILVFVPPLVQHRDKHRQARTSCGLLPYQQIVLNNYLDGKSTEFHIKLEHCGCQRKIRTEKLSSNSEMNIWINQTTCGIDAFSRGMGQKIVGISLFGDYTMRRL